MEPVSVVTSFLHLSDTLRQDLGQDGQEGKDCCSKYLSVSLNINILQNNEKLLGHQIALREFKCNQNLNYLPMN